MSDNDSKDGYALHHMSVWLVKLESGFTVNVVWLKKDDPDFKEIFKHNYKSATLSNSQPIDPLYLVYNDEEFQYGTSKF